jgi:hypothetical protein
MAHNDLQVSMHAESEHTYEVYEPASAMMGQVSEVI